MMKDELKDRLYAEADIQSRDMRGIIAVIVEFTSEWLEEQHDDDALLGIQPSPRQLADRLRQDME